MSVKPDPARAAARGTDRQRVRSVEIGAAVLLALAELESPVSLSRLSAKVGMPGAKLHRYLQALINSGLAAHDPGRGRYALGPAALTVGLAALDRPDLIGTASERLALLRDETGQTCFLSVWGNRGPTVVRVAEAPGSVTIVTRVGSVLPLSRSATGLLFAAFLPASALAALPDADRPDATEAELTRIRTERAACVRGLLVPGIDAVAAPVLDAGGRIAASLTSLGLAPAFDAAPDGAVADALRAAAADIQASIGAAPPGRARASPGEAS